MKFFKRRLKRSKNQFMKNSKNDENEPKLGKNAQKRLKMCQKWPKNVKKWIFTQRYFSISPTFPTN
tara:strand:+ start:2910 stop:3107 length:198 start_codon:yes stop_codon:yes gene_type:complete